ncbi:hypothetical protein KUS54_RS24795 [Escherichia coli]|uniref:hypothetical protein n=1 Tax=Escherichia coli TaxID=562 RepID=UPI0017E8F093|nr:hypothetical protein [Escherichia coli]EJE7372315.1 hypothetical protein [Shigella dysenteriae]EER2914987.1 hypothetical protein [Escherichia coli]EFB3864475.1 hypothetical protein [Escherichia coli]EHR8715250.1 hypothetical protein [Escherichia coli]EKM5305789.1 hypothetical protein [Escherichia coli]
MPFFSDIFLYGYNIFQNLEYRLSTKTLINIKNGRIKRFGTTKARLFEYLLEGMDAGVVYDEEIIVHVFYNNGLRCSKSYLLTMIKEVKLAFNSVGFERYPFSRLKGKAYKIEENALTRIYIIKKTSFTNALNSKG